MQRHRATRILKCPSIDRQAKCYIDITSRIRVSFDSLWNMLSKRLSLGKSKMDTLLFYINTINVGGAERVIIQLAHHFANKGYRSVLVTSFMDKGKEYDIPDNVTRFSIENEEVKQSRIKRNYSRIKALRGLIKREKPVAVISFMAEPNFRAIIATIGLSTKRIISIRNDPDREYAGKIGRFVGKHVLPYADGCVFQTEDAKAWFPQKLQRKSKVILNDVKEEFFEVQRKEVCNVISIGRLSKQKNHVLLIQAFAAIADKYPKQKLLIYGTGILEKNLKSLIYELGTERQIFLMGSTKDVAGVLSKAKVFVLSSDYEGMPNCLMEALAAGVPCISTDCPCGGPKTLIRNGENGIFVPVGDKEAMTTALDLYLSNSEYAELCGKKSKEVARQFHPNHIFQQWELYVKEVIER